MLQAIIDKVEFLYISDVEHLLMLPNLLHNFFFKLFQCTFKRNSADHCMQISDCSLNVIFTEMPVQCIVAWTRCTLSPVKLDC